MVNTLLPAISVFIALQDTICEHTRYPYSFTWKVLFSTGHSPLLAAHRSPLQQSSSTILQAVQRLWISASNELMYWILLSSEGVQSEHPPTVLKYSKSVQFWTPLYLYYWWQDRERVHTVNSSPTVQISSNVSNCTISASPYSPCRWRCGGGPDVL